MSKTKYVLSLMNPLRPIKEVFKSANSLKNTVVDAGTRIQELHETSAKQRNELNADPVVKAGRKIKSDKERFEFIATQNGLTPRILRQRLHTVKRKQAVLGTLTVLFIAVSLTVILFAQQNLLFSVVSVVILTLGNSVLLGETVRQGLYKTQLRERELMGWRKFSNRDDFWKAAFTPW